METLGIHTQVWIWYSIEYMRTGKVYTLAEVSCQSLASPSGICLVQTPLHTRNNIQHLNPGTRVMISINASTFQWHKGKTFTRKALKLRREIPNTLHSIPRYLPCTLYISPLPSPVPHLPFPISRSPSLVSHLPFPASRLLSIISRLLTPVSHLSTSGTTVCRTFWSYIFNTRRLAGFSLEVYNFEFVIHLWSTQTTLSKM